MNITPQEAYYFCATVLKGRSDELEEIILQDYIWSFFYARDVIQGRWPEAEPIIMKDLSYSFFYARDVIKGRWHEAECLFNRHYRICTEYKRLFKMNWK